MLKYIYIVNLFAITKVLAFFLINCNNNKTTKPKKKKKNNNNFKVINKSRD